MNKKLIFKEDDREYFNSRQKKADKIIKELWEEGISPGKKISLLEVGCNHGFISYHIAEKTRWKIYAGDTNTQNLNKYAWIRKKVRIAYLDATKMNYEKEKFDVVIYNHVIEHIPQWEKTIKEIYRILKKGGLLYLATPNIYRKIAKPEILFKNKKNIDRKARIKHHMGFSSEEIKALLKPFSDIKCINKKHFVNNAPKPAGAILSLLPEKIHEKYAQTNVFIARK